MSLASGVMNASDVTKILAPSGVLRAAINLGNAVLAQRSNEGILTGVSVFLARRLAERLGVTLDIRVYDAAGKVVDALANGEWDLAFLAIDPKRGEEIAFTQPYVKIDGTYLVRDTAPYQTCAALDKLGSRIAVGKGSAYALFLSRTLQHARIDQLATAPLAFAHFIDGELDAVAGVRKVLENVQAQHKGLRVLDDAFMTIPQALGVPKSREAAVPYLAAFVDEMAQSGAIASALQV